MAEASQAPPPGSEPLANLKWEKFAQYMAKGQSQADAYEMAGYKYDTANADKLAGKSQIFARLRYLRSKRAEKLMADPVPEPRHPQASLGDIKPTRAYVLTGLVENVEIALGRRLTLQTVLVRRRGKEPVTFQVEVTDRNVHGANRALELLGKEIGLFDGKSAAANDAEDETAKRLREDLPPEVLARLLRVELEKKR